MRIGGDRNVLFVSTPSETTAMKCQTEMEHLEAPFWIPDEDFTEEADATPRQNSKCKPVQVPFVVSGYVQELFQLLP
ncbi:hypothetical protein HPB48_021939 [Haemaphysalis longicornis]|uniref:Uncharacterized protein n=1 Tax=Haemaphysalis longicornis TaxID=44386 RepID=A0A9J6GK22_HAELO|nr:hypothetical protein HPB48_021939 [Haemaphysalis longicornis]